MLTLYQFPTAFGLPNLSPFCMKLECFLKMAQIDYRVSEIIVASKAPKRKAPFIEDDQVRMGDSALIIQYLQRRHGVDLDAELSPRQRAQSLAFEKMLDEHLYWALVYSRWGDERFWPTVKQWFFADLPAPLRPIVPRMARRMVRRQLYQQGLGRHEPEEIYAFGRADIDALAVFLGDGDFMHGAQPTLVDACAVSYVANLLMPPLDTPLKAAAKAHDNLGPYCERMMQRFFGGTGD